MWNSLHTRNLAAILASLFLIPTLTAAPPEVTYLYPPGAQLGVETTVTAGGKLETWPPEVWASRPGLTIKPAKKGTFTIKPDADMVPGVVHLRLHNPEGASSLVPFIVGGLAERLEKEPNNSLSQAEKVPANIVINGKLQQGNDVDCFEFSAKAGETIVADLVCNRLLGSPADPVLQIVSADGFVLAQSHDDMGLDPRIAFKAPKDGNYIARVFTFPSTPNSSIAFAGGDNYIYRLTITNGPFVDYPVPLSANKDKPGKIEAVGWNLPKDNRLSLTPFDSQFGSAWRKELPFSVPIILEDWDNNLAIDSDKGGSPNQPVSLPASVTGRINEQRGSNSFEIEAKKGAALNIEVRAPSLGLPMTPLVRIFDQQGKLLQRYEPAQVKQDLTTTFNPPADGRYRVEIRDLFADGGDRFVYVARLFPVSPGFDLTLPADRVTLAPNESKELTLNIARRGGYQGQPKLEFPGLPDGIKVETVSNGGNQQAGGGRRGGSGGRRGGSNNQNANTIVLKLTANETYPGGPFQIHATDPALSERPVIATNTIDTLNYKTADLWLTVTAPPKKPEPKDKK